LHVAAGLEASRRPLRRRYHRTLTWENLRLANRLITVHTETTSHYAITSSGHCARRRFASGIRETTEIAR
jgi:hypothetical protein